MPGNSYAELYARDADDGPLAKRTEPKRHGRNVARLIAGTLAVAGFLLAHMVWLASSEPMRAGHTHCGQLSLPLFGPLFTKSAYGQRHSCGIVREGSRTSLITAGLGTSVWPLRFGVPPDFWIIDIGR